MSGYKPIGGVVFVKLYPADAVTSAEFSDEGVRLEVEEGCNCVEVELVDDRSSLEDSVESRSGVLLVKHQLELIALRNSAAAWLEREFLEMCATVGVVAVVEMTCGRKVVVGVSESFLTEQPLRLDSLTSLSGRSPLDAPLVHLRLVSQDCSLAGEFVE